MWLDNLKELKKKTGKSAKQIAELTNLPERTISRIFSGDTNAPRVDTLRRIVAVLDASLDDIFVESGSVVADTDLITAQAEVARLKEEVMSLQAENAILKDENVRLSAENDLLRLKLEHKDEIINLHNYYMKLNNSNQ